MPASPSTIEQIFADALALPDGTERASFLNEVCGADSAMRRRVERLLQAYGHAVEFLETPATPFTPLSNSPLELGVQVGSYRLLQQLGEGGMGVVYVAEQIEPVQRQVALKIIKPGMDSRQVIARFEAERQALSLMDHPNIAKVLDAGTVGGSGGRSCECMDAGGDFTFLPRGRPYFVMELVRGTPITQYCDQRQLTARERLELFVPVCQAIQHAHQKGIIHRDLKPSNILVGEYDNQPLPKVIDFGVAKAVGRSFTERSVFTESGQIVGTLEYMSPEQAKLSHFDIDTRSDIYSLGVLLYELLTGTTPFDQGRLHTLAFDETLRIIREEEPDKPSTRLQKLRCDGSEARSTRGSRHTLPTTPRRSARRAHIQELDWIVMKCLEKDRSQRYESASGLARDVQRFLRDEPVVAGPPSPWYRFRKLVQRNKTGFAATVAALLVVFLGIAALAASNYLIRLEQARTLDEQRRTEHARRLADQRAEEVRQGLERLIEGNALLERGRWYVMERHWDDADAAFSRAIELHPQHVSVWVERADLYTRLGLWDLAAADYAREMQLRQPNTTARWFQHALLRRSLGDEAGCRKIARELRQRFAGTIKNSFVEDIVRANALVTNPDLEDLSQLIALAQEAAPSRHATIPFVLGAAYFRAGQDQQAIDQLEQALAAEPSMPIRWISYPLLAMAHHRLGHEAEARQALEAAARALDEWTERRYSGQDYYWVIHQGADAYWPAPWWDYLECQLFFDEAKRMIDGAPPADDARLHVLRARALAGLNRLDEAAVEYDAALRLRADDPQIQLERRRNGGRCLVEREQWHAAAVEFEGAVALRPDDTYLWRYQAVAELAAGEHAAYEHTCRSMLERFSASKDSFAVGNLLLICTLREQALPDMSVLLPLAERAGSLWHWGAWGRGAALYRAGLYEQSVQCFEAAAKRYRPRAWDWCFLAMGHHQLGDTDHARRCLSEAAHWIDAANRRTEADPTDTHPAWGNWHEQVVYPLLLREAETLLAEDARTLEPVP